MKKLLILPLVLMMMACGPTTDPTSSTTSDDTPTTSETSVVQLEKKVEFAPVHLYSDMPTLKITPLFSYPELAEEEHFVYTPVEEGFVSIEGNVMTYVNSGRTIIKAKSESFDTQFIVFTHEGFSTVGGPLANSYQNIQSFYEDHSSKEDTTLFIGDSFFQFWRDGTAGASFRNDFRGKNAVNLGINGTTTHHWRAILEQYLKDNVIAPKNIIFNIGINNVDDLSEDGTGGGRNVRMLLEEFHAAFPTSKLYYFSVTRCSKGTFATYWDRHNGINTYLKENFFSKVDYATYMDANEIFGDDYADYRMTDGLHLNTRGYAVFKSLISEHVEIEDL